MTYKDFEVVKIGQKDDDFVFVINLPVSSSNSTHLLVPIYIRKKLLYDLWKYIRLNSGEQ